MANKIYNRHFADLLNGLADMDDTSNVAIYCALLSTSHTPQSTHNLWTDVNGDEVSSTGYSSGGVQLANVSITEDDTNDLAKFDSDNPTWSNVSLTARYAVLYFSTAGSTGGKDLIGLWDFGAAKTASNGDFTVQVSTNGWLKTAQGTT